MAERRILARRVRVPWLSMLQENVLETRDTFPATEPCLHRRKERRLVSTKCDADVLILIYELVFHSVPCGAKTVRSINEQR